MASSQVVKSLEPFQGLPTYQNGKFSNLTAIVTGANGMSGYHMVRVLAAAPERWSKIYCLSRRPPPVNFYEDLGEGATRVEHIAIDFLGHESKIATQIKERIPKVDYVFFFSYMQPRQEGHILGMWSDADKLGKINCTSIQPNPVETSRKQFINYKAAILLKNFINGLQQSGLKPQRFLLQTGAKHYGFHIGPATNPSFESDLRVPLETNFYYPQEDLLSEYCRSTGVSWNVVRPSYIIGAVRDSALNHMVGLAIYAAVQAHLKKPLAFPGDYNAWDRECCQSTALLNAYFEEWAVLTDGAANEAFNSQDGLPFTWGRFWAYLAQWYGTSWTPPEEDDANYRVTNSRWKENPRGYGPRGTTRSTFSFQEWSEHPENQAAWQELVQTHDLTLEPFSETNRAQIFGMTDSAVLGGWPLSLSMRKSRRLGFLGTVDSYETAFTTIRDLARLRIVAPPVVPKFAP